MEKLNELVELANNATGGDWFVEDWNEVKSLRRCEGGKGVVCSVTEYGSMDEGFEHNLKFISAANPETILAIAEAFRALEQRAEAAEANHQSCTNVLVEAVLKIDELQAKLVELEKQDPVAWVLKDAHRETSHLERNKQVADLFSVFKGNEVTPLFTRPAPAINLSELVPINAPIEVVENMDEVLDVHICDTDMQSLWSVCRTAILRNIEEANR